ncbi:MAG TPA: immunoglobulin domain-containing protein [Opitutaceae bacterium]|nr:immunoglobulin domain-containing protein [Opitutaceae bacterium]
MRANAPFLASVRLLAPRLVGASLPHVRFSPVTRWIAVVLLLGAAAGVPGRAATAQIDAAATEQTIRGFGGATVFLPSTPLAGGDLDTLFGNGPGQIGFTLLRIRVAPDDAWRAIELANAQGAVARGARVIATPWSPPAAMKNNGSLIGGMLNPTSYADFAAYLNTFATYMAANQAPLFAISVQNEPDITVTYESCDWTAAQMLAFCRDNAGAITATRVIAPESFQFNHAMSDPVLNDATAAANIDIVGGHIYGGGLAPYPLAMAKGKEVWMTEHLDLSTDWAGALGTAKEIHDCLATANFSAYIWWYLRRYYGPLGEDSIVTKRGWVMAQFAKFIRPGFVRVDATAAPATGVSVSAYRGDKLVVVAINQVASDVTQSFSVANATVRTVTPWVTSASLNLQAQPALAVANGAFTATLPASSITTFVGDLIFPAPALVTPPQSHRVAAGSTVVLDVTATGESLGYQWYHLGTAIAGATDRLLTLRNVGAADAGAYTVTVTNTGGSVTSQAATLTVAAGEPAGRLVNLSTRSLVGTNDAVQIAGFVIGGTTPKTVVVRASGPALQSSFGLTGVLDDPMIELHDSATGAIVASNDNWDATLAPTFASLGAFPWTQDSRDAALQVTLPPGGYTAIVTGHNGSTGVALVEVYEADGATASSLINLSTRSLVGTGDDVQIGGFVISGTTARTVVIRAAGPMLRKGFRLTGAVADPVIALQRLGDSEILASSDDWTSDLAAHFARVGAFSWLPETADAAIVTTLDPGAYTVLVRGKNATTGIALVELYAEP